MLGLAMARASPSVSATTIWRNSPIAVPPGNSGLGTGGPEPLASALRYAAMFSLASAVGPLAAKCMPRSPDQAAPIGFEEPYQNGGCGCCRGLSAIGTFV